MKRGSRHLRSCRSRRIGGAAHAHHSRHGHPAHLSASRGRTPSRRKRRAREPTARHLPRGVTLKSSACNVCLFIGWPLPVASGSSPGRRRSAIGPITPRLWPPPASCSAACTCLFPQHHHHVRHARRQAAQPCLAQHLVTSYATKREPAWCMLTATIERNASSSRSAHSCSADRRRPPGRACCG
jgi:hypothetical protein